MNSASLWLPGLLVMTGLVVLSGFFSASETALFSLSRDALRSMQVGKRRERTVAELLRDPDRLLTGILFWNLVVNLTYFAVSVLVAHRLIQESFSAAAGAFSLFGLAGIIVFGEVLPKSVAVILNQKVATWVSLPLAISVRLLDPFLPFLTPFPRLIRRAIWPTLQREPYLQTEDLERSVEATKLSDEVIRQERQILHNILDLSEITAEEAIRPRGMYVSKKPPIHLEHLDGHVPLGDYLIVRETGSEEIESAIALGSFSSIAETHLEEASEDVVHVPWCATLAYTLQLLRENFSGVAAVVNEYGETIGIITYEDIIDTILSPEPSRAKRLLQREPVVETESGSYHVEGITTLRYLCKRLGIDYEPGADGLITVAGMLHEELERIPVPEDQCTWEGYQITVIEVTQRGQLKVEVSHE